MKLDGLYKSFLISGHIIQAYYVCERQVWLLSRKISQYQGHSNLSIGRLIHKNSYKRERKEIKIGNLKFDFIKKEEDKYIVGEIKKSSRLLESAKMQLVFYLVKLRDDYGIEAMGRIMVPREKIKIEVILNEKIEEKLEKVKKDIKRIYEMENPPDLKKTRFCRGCAYYEFCWI